MMLQSADLGRLFWQILTVGIVVAVKIIGNSCIMFPSTGMNLCRNDCECSPLKKGFVPVFSRVPSLLLSNQVSKIRNLQFLSSFFGGHNCNISPRSH